MQSFAVGIFLLAALLISGLTALRIMAKVTIESLDEIISMIDVADDDPSPMRTISREIGRWRTYVASLLRSPWQFYVMLVFGIIIVVRMGSSITLDPNWESKMVWPILVNLVVLVPVILFVVCPIIWMMVCSVFILQKICQSGSLLAVNPLSPMKTMGLEKWKSITAVYTLTAGLVLSWGCAIPVVGNYLAGRNSNGAWFWFVIILPLLLFYGTYPYVKLGALVKSLKVRRMHLFKIRIAEIFDHWLKHERERISTVAGEAEPHTPGDLAIPQEQMRLLDEMGSYYQVFQKIDASPDSYIDVHSLLELGQAIGIPSLFALLSYLFL